MADTAISREEEGDSAINKEEGDTVADTAAATPLARIIASTKPLEGTTGLEAGAARESATPSSGETASTGRSAGTPMTDRREGTPSAEQRATVTAPATTLLPSIKRFRSDGGPADDDDCEKKFVEFSFAGVMISDKCLPHIVNKLIESPLFISYLKLMLHTAAVRS